MKRSILILFNLCFVLTMSAQQDTQLELKPSTFKQISVDEAQMEGKNLSELMGDQTYLFSEKVRDRNGDICALVKLRIKNMSLTEIKQLDIFVSTDVAIMKKLPSEGQLWVYLTGKETDFAITHPSFGKSNVVKMSLKAEKVYEIQLVNGTTADVSFHSNPPGADVYINNDWKGKTSKEGFLSISKLPYGSYTIRVQRNSIVDEKKIEITENGERSYSFTVMDKKTFYFNSNPQGASLFVDGTKVGTTPMSYELTLEYHDIKATLDGEQDDFLRDFAKADIPNTITLNVVKKKSVLIAAVLEGSNITGAKVNINNEDKGSTPLTVDLPYAKHKVTVQYAGRSKTKNIKVTEKGDSYFKFKLPNRTSITWPWEKDIDLKPVGWSLGYIQKQWVQTYENQKQTWGFWENTKQLHGIQTGLRLNFHFWSGLGANTGLFYEFYYSKSNSYTVQDEFGTDYGDGYGKFTEHALYMPLNLEYRLQLSDNIQFFVNGGIGLDCGLFADVESYLDGESDPYFSDGDIYGMDFYGNYSRFNVSAEFGAGIRIKHLQLNFNMARGLLNQSSGDDYGVVKQNKMMLSLSLMY